MKWKNTSIDNITTYNTIYFDEKYKNICERICNILYIDCFPLFKEKAYMTVKNSSWKRHNIDYDINGIDDVFDEKLLNLFSQNDSNIIFVSKNNSIEGVIHFTNYEIPIVYSNVYQNLNVFEKQFRLYLELSGLNDKVFIEYLHKKKLPKANDVFRKKIEDTIRTIELSREKRNFVFTYLNELMEFGVSSFHDKETLQKLDLGFLKTKYVLQDNINVSISHIIRDLRNFIMHHNSISGEGRYTPFDFENFRLFFKRMLYFKIAFNALSERIFNLNRNKLVSINRKNLELFNNMKDEEIKDHFYNLT